MAASLTDKFMRVGNPGTLTSLQSPGKALAASSITIGSGSNWESTTGFIIAIRTVDSSGVEVANTYTEWIATYPGSGTTVTINPVPVTGSDQVYTAGTNTQVFIPISAKRDDLMVDGLLAQHTQAGAHTGITTDTMTATGIVTAASFVQTGGAASNGYTVGLPAPNTITYNGNRSYNMVFNASDQTGVLSAGMRLRTTRTVVAPTQCFSGNGTTNYFNKTSPAGMTFTNNFVVSAWIKLASYPTVAGTIVSRWDGTNGWGMYVTASGQVQLYGSNAAASNFSNVQSYQSIPLNKWVHIAAQLDMSTFTATTTTSYVMIDGVDVPSTVARGGTNPTALIQAGNLQIGARNSTDFISGKVAQVAIYSAKVTQATILAAMHQTINPAATSLISGYDFNNSINDLNVSNANNLTANGSAVATNADSPFGGQAGGTISSTLDYGIVQSVTFSTNTTVVVQVPEGCTIPTSGGVSAVVYSSNKVPYGFPSQRGKWTINAFLGTLLSTTVTGGTWTTTNLALTIPVGEWNWGYSGYAEFGGSVSASTYGRFGLGTSTVSVLPETVSRQAISAGSTYFGTEVNRIRPVSIAAQAQYSIITNVESGGGTLTFVMGVAPLVSTSKVDGIIAENAYL